MTTKNKLIIAIVSFLLTVALVLFPFLWNASLNGHIRGSSFYLEKSYVDFYGGKEAKAFFEKYITSNKYIAIDFHYSDDGKLMFPLMRSCTAFVVDIYYEEDVFNEVIGNLISDGSEPLPINYSFSFVTIESNDEAYEDNFAAIGWDVDHNTVRYVFICDVKNGNAYKIQTAYLRFYDLNWNSNEHDLIFDYSELNIGIDELE